MIRSVERRILVLVDERESRAALVAALAVHGHACFVARDADELVASLDLVQPDVVLFEWATRLESRLGLAHRVRAAAARTVLVAIVSHAPEPEGFRAREGIDAYFTQPVQLQELSRALQR